MKKILALIVFSLNFHADLVLEITESASKPIKIAILEKNNNYDPKRIPGVIDYLNNASDDIVKVFNDIYKDIKIFIALLMQVATGSVFALMKLIVLPIIISLFESIPFIPKLGIKFYLAIASLVIIAPIIGSFYQFINLII